MIERTSISFGIKPAFILCFLHHSFFHGTWTAIRIKFFRRQYLFITFWTHFPACCLESFQVAIRHHWSDLSKVVAQALICIKKLLQLLRQRSLVRKKKNGAPSLRCAIISSAQDFTIAYLPTLAGPYINGRWRSHWYDWSNQLCPQCIASESLQGS